MELAYRKNGQWSKDNRWSDKGEKVGKIDQINSENNTKQGTLGQNARQLVPFFRREAQKAYVLIREGLDNRKFKEFCQQFQDPSEWVIQFKYYPKNHIIWAWESY